MRCIALSKRLLGSFHTVHQASSYWKNTFFLGNNLVRDDSVLQLAVPTLPLQEGSGGLNKTWRRVAIRTSGTSSSVLHMPPDASAARMAAVRLTGGLRLAALPSAGRAPADSGRK